MAIYFFGDKDKKLSTLPCFHPLGCCFNDIWTPKQSNLNDIKTTRC